jgi:hypothetical protein
MKKLGWLIVDEVLREREPGSAGAGAVCLLSLGITCGAWIVIIVASI